MEWGTDDVWSDETRSSGWSLGWFVSHPFLSSLTISSGHPLLTPYVACRYRREPEDMDRKEKQNLENEGR